jgi:hypothetical protein
MRLPGKNAALIRRYYDETEELYKVWFDSVASDRLKSEDPQITALKLKPVRTLVPHRPGVYGVFAKDKQVPECANSEKLDALHRLIKVKLGHSKDGKRRVSQVIREVPDSVPGETFWVECKQHSALEECLKTHLEKKLAPHIEGRPYPTETFILTMEELTHVVQACQCGMNVTDDLIATDPVLRNV